MSCVSPEKVVCEGKLWDQQISSPDLFAAGSIALPQLKTPSEMDRQWIVVLAAVAFTAVEASSLAAALEEALMPVLTQMSSTLTMGRNHSDWTFAYTDAETSVSFCAGYSDLVSKTHCSANDTFAWGSTTKVMTSTLVLQMIEDGKFELDESIVPNANPFLHSISDGKSDLVSLYGPQIWNVTIRHLLQMSSGIQEYDDAFSTAYQNSHRQADLSPVWVLNNSNRTFVCAPGTCGLYSSTNYGDGSTVALTDY